MRRAEHVLSEDWKGSASGRPARPHALFEKGNGHAVRHGGTATVSLREAALAAADQLIEVLDTDYDERYVFAAKAAGLAIERVETAVSYHDELRVRLADGDLEEEVFLERMGKAEEALGRAHRDLWKWLSAMGLTPASDAALVRDRGVAADTGSRAAERVRRHVAKRREQGELDAGK